MPSLLSLLDRDRAAAIGQDDSSSESGLTPELLLSLLSEVDGRRRRSRLISWAAAGAAAVMLVIGVLCAVQAHSLPSVPAPVQASVLVPPRPQVNATDWPRQSRAQRLDPATQPLVDLHDVQVSAVVYVLDIDEPVERRFGHDGSENSGYQ